MPLDYGQLLGSAGNDSAGSTGNEMPTYQYNADNHNYGNGNFAITDPSTWGQGLSDASKFIVSAAASGVNGFYNTGVTVGNWFGADLEQNDVATQLSAVDDDLGKYYQQNREAADLAGFVLTSIVPGMAGVKLLNAGQKVLRVAGETGMLGANLSKATGLLTPSVNAYRSLAAAEIAQSSATFSLTAGNTLKAIGAGYGQAALESAAFEVAVAATSFKSPTLEDADGWDIAKNILVGTVTGGIIGGAITHAVTVGSIKSAVKGLNPAEKLFTDTSDLTGLSASQRILARQERLSTLPSAPTADEISSGSFQAAQGILKDLPPTEREVVAGGLSTKFNRMRTETETSLQLKNRSDFHELSNGDKELGNQVADFSAALDSNTTLANLSHLESLGRIGSKLKQESVLAKYETDIAAIKNDPSFPKETAPYRIGYVKLAGEDAGKISFEAPGVLSIADTAKSTDEVLKTIKGYGFKENKVFDPAINADHLEMEARYQWADRTAIVKPGMTIGEHDIPLLEKAVAEKIPNITVASTDGNYTIDNLQDITKHLEVSKKELASKLMDTNAAGNKITTEEIAKITNMKQSYLEGEISQNPSADLYARQGQKAEYVKYLEDNKLYSQAKEDSFGLQPTYAKAAYNTKEITDADGYQLAGMAYLKAQQKLYQQGVDNVFADNVPADQVGAFWHPGDDVMLKANRYGSGPGLFTFANGAYHTAESWAESIGSATSRLQKSLKDGTSDTLQGSLYKLRSNQEAAIEFESINKTLQSTSELYGINADGTALEPLRLIDYKAGISAGKTGLVQPVLQEGAPTLIPIKTPEALEAWNARTQLTANRTTAFQDIRNAQGLTDMKDPRALRPVRPDPKDYPYYAVVTDPSITGVGHKSMLHAASADELEKLISKVPDNYEVYKGDQLKQFFKAQGEFDYERTLHENYIDADLKRSGVNNPFFMRTDPQLIAESILKDHLRSDDIFARELVNAKYEKEFGFLRQQGEQYTNTATSKYTGSYRDIENSTQNPYLNYVKTALNISQVSEHPYIMGLNNKLDAAVSSGWNKITEAFSAAKSPADLDKVNSLLSQFGVKSAYKDAATELLANHTAPKGVLSKFVGQANSILSTLVTRLDPFNAINNAVGSTVLYGSELKSFIRAMGTDDTELAGKLSGLLKTPAPLTENITQAGIAAQAAAGTAPDTVTTSGKIFMNAIKNFMDPEAKTLAGQPLKEYYAANGWSSRLRDQFHSVMENLTLTGSEDAGLLSQKMNSAFATAKVLAEKGEVYTGNKLAEEFNRFVSADSMRQLTDLGVQAGKITEGEARGYINTFVNRTQGNILASQRPLMFQGPIGQAVGMFQTFQFNTMQQLFRHVAEGQGKDAAMLLGLQGTMYGMNGLPAFNFLNTHIVGSLSGNPQHTDAYSATYGIAGKSVGDLLLYGIPSNFLQGNLYTRGDINPRSVTVIPTNPADIPFINATTRMYDNVKNVTSKIANGGAVWESLLQGIEHNGLSRPLAGLAQVAQAATHEGNVFSTTNKGNISGANELMSWATAVRLSGGKPFDEAVANDATFRIQAYQAVDRNRMDALGQAVKSQVVGGAALPDGDTISNFAQQYASIGGKQQNFNKFMMNEIKSANTSQANKIMEALHNPYSQKMQQIMGGTEGLDGRSF